MSTTTPAADRGTERMEARRDGDAKASPIGPLAPDALDRRYQALSDPKRRRILALLRKGERCVCELVDAMDVSQSLLSFHLKTLKDADLVDDRKDGRWVHYRARPDALAELRAHLSGLAPGGGNGAGAASPDLATAPRSGDEAGRAAPEHGGGAGEPYRCC